MDHSICIRKKILLNLCFTPKPSANAVSIPSISITKYVSPLVLNRVAISKLEDSNNHLTCLPESAWHLFRLLSTQKPECHCPNVDYTITILSLPSDPLSLPKVRESLRDTNIIRMAETVQWNIVPCLYTLITNLYLIICYSYLFLTTMSTFLPVEYKMSGPVSVKLHHL